MNVWTVSSRDAKCGGTPRKRFLLALTAGLLIFSCGESGGPTSVSPVSAPASDSDGSHSTGTSSTSSSSAKTSANPLAEEFNCTHLMERFVRFSDPGFVNGSHVGLYYDYQGAPSGRAKLEMFWDEANDPSGSEIVSLGFGEPQRDDDGLTDHKGVVEHRYAGITGPTEKRVRANFIIEGKTGNCATVRTITVTPSAGGPSSPGFTQPGSLTTLFAANNSFAGNTFDVVPSVRLEVTGFDVNLGPGSMSTIAVYWRSGTALGNESNPAGWTLLGTDSVTPAGLNLPTAVNVGGLVLQAGQTYGFYIEVQSYPSASMQYTNGGPTTFSNADLSLTTYHGKGNPAFSGSSFFPRQWNGTIKYRK